MVIVIDVLLFVSFLCTCIDLNEFVYANALVYVSVSESWLIILDEFLYTCLNADTSLGCPVCGCLFHPCLEWFPESNQIEVTDVQLWMIMMHVLVKYPCARQWARVNGIGIIADRLVIVNLSQTHQCLRSILWTANGKHYRGCACWFSSSSCAKSPSPPILALGQGLGFHDGPHIACWSTCSKIFVHLWNDQIGYESEMLETIWFTCTNLYHFNQCS